MEMLFGMISLVKDINTMDREYKNLNLQLKYILDKGKNLLSKINTSAPDLPLRWQILKTRMQECQVLSKKLDELLMEEEITLRNKIRLSMPFDKTKTEVTNAMQCLQKIVNDLKQQITEQSKIDRDFKEGPVKRRFSDSESESENNPFKNNRKELTVNEIPEQQQSQIYQMRPTVEDGMPIYSQSPNHSAKREYYLDFKITVEGSPEVMKILKQQKNKQILEFNKTVYQKDMKEQTILHTVARVNFMKCYKQISSVNKDIDRISTKSHFHFVLRDFAPKNQSNIHHSLHLHPQNTQPLSSCKKSTKQRQSGSQKSNQDVFYSFPVQNECHNFKILARKQHPSKAMYRKRGPEWIKIQELEVEIGNGDCIAAFSNPEQQPSIYFRICYQIKQGHSD